MKIQIIILSISGETYCRNQLTHTNYITSKSNGCRYFTPKQIKQKNSDIITMQQTLQTTRSVEQLLDFGSTNNEEWLRVKEPHLHIFNRMQFSSAITSLENYLEKQKIPFKEYHNYNDLATLVKTLKGRHLVIIETVQNPASNKQSIFPSNHIYPNETSDIKICSYPGQMISKKYTCLANQQQVGKKYATLTGEELLNSRIKLKSVQSIRDLKKYKTESMKNLMQAPVAQKYDKLLYLINAYSDEERDNIGKKYEAFVSQIINNKRSIFSFKTFNEMNVLCQSLKPNCKHLLLLSTNDKSVKILQSLSVQQREDVFDVVMLGNMLPNKNMLEKNLILATNSEEQVKTFLANASIPLIYQENQYQAKDAETPLKITVHTTKSVRFQQHQAVNQYSLPSKNITEQSNFSIPNESAKMKPTNVPTNHIFVQEQFQLTNTLPGNAGNISLTKPTKTKQYKNWIVDKNNKNEFQTVQQNATLGEHIETKPKEINVVVPQVVTPQNISTNVVEVAKPQQQEASPPANDSGDDSKSQNASIDLSQSSHRKKLKRKIVVKNDQKSQDEMTLTDPTGRAGLQKFATFQNVTDLNVTHEAPQPQKQKDTMSLQDNVPSPAKARKQINRDINKRVNNSKPVKHSRFTQSQNQDNESNSGHPTLNDLGFEESQKIVQQTIKTNGSITNTITSKNVISTPGSLTTRNMTIERTISVEQFPKAGPLVPLPPFKSEKQQQKQKQRMQTYKKTYNVPPSTIQEQVDQYWVSSHMSQENKNNNSTKKNTQLTDKKSTVSLAMPEPEECEMEGKSQVVFQEEEIGSFNNKNYRNLIEEDKEVVVEYPKKNQQVEYPKNNQQTVIQTTTLQVDAPHISPKTLFKKFEEQHTVHTVKTTTVNSPTIQYVTQPVATYTRTPYVTPVVTNTTKISYADGSHFDLTAFDRIERNGVVCYVKKGTGQSTMTQSTPRHSFDFSPVSGDALIRQQSISRGDTPQIIPARVYHQPTKYQTTTYSSSNASNDTTNYYKPVISNSFQTVSYSNNYQQLPTANYENRYEKVNLDPINYQPTDRLQSSTVQKVEEQQQVLRFPTFKPQYQQTVQRATVTAQKSYQPGQYMTISRTNRLDSNSLNNNMTASIGFSKSANNKYLMGAPNILREMNRRRYLDTSINKFQFFVDSELTYLLNAIINSFASKTDDFDTFCNSQQLYSRADMKRDVSVGLVIGKKQNAGLVTISRLPKSYYVVSLQDYSDDMLIIDDMSKKVEMNSLAQLPLLKKVVLDGLLDKYVIYNADNSQARELGTLFQGTQYNVEGVTLEIDQEVLHCFFEEESDMIRLTIICNEEELSKYQACVQSYASHNKAFNQKCCRLLCITNGARNGEINVGGTLVSFIPASTNFNCYEDVLNYMRPAYQAVPTYIPNERLYYSARHARLNQLLSQQFPCRFEMVIFNSYSEVQSNLLKSSSKIKSYLILDENQQNQQQLPINQFNQVYLLGTSKPQHPLIKKAPTVHDLIQMLRK